MKKYTISFKNKMNERQLWTKTFSSREEAWVEFLAVDNKSMIDPIVVERQEECKDE